MPPSLFQQLATERDIAEIEAYYNLKKEFDGKPPPFGAMSPDEWFEAEVKAAEARGDG